MKMSDIETIGWIATLWDKIKNSAFLNITAWCGVVLWCIIRLGQRCDMIILLPENCEKWINLCVLFSCAYLIVICVAWIRSLIVLIIKSCKEQKKAKTIEQELDKIYNEPLKYENFIKTLAIFDDEDMPELRITDKYITALTEKRILNRFENIRRDSHDKLVARFYLSESARKYIAAKEIEAEMALIENKTSL